MKEKQNHMALPLACCFPWVFLFLYADLLCANFLWLAVMALGNAILGLWIRRDSTLFLLFLGNGISFFFTCLLLVFFQEPGWNAYFKPFRTFGTAAVFQGFAAMLQYVIFLWKKERSLVQNFFLAVFLILLVSGTVLYGFLCIKAAQIGAV